MSFNSLDFALFLPIVFLLYWFVMNRNLRVQNLLIVAASYVFYGWWDWTFLSLIVVSTIIDFSVGRGLAIQKEPLKRKGLLWLSIIANLGMLGFFKYYNFFLDNFVAAFSFFGNEINPGSLNVILPVGISFYTFQTLSYTIDVYKGKLEPTKDFIAFSAFVTFFPQLVAGPIERATKLLPQFGQQRFFIKEKAYDGLRQILWGLFKKVVIADGCAEIANLIFDNSGAYGASTLVVGAVAFTFQIYADFSGYSDIAIGTARLFGFDLCRNFAFPFFSRDIAEFWRRWHISLSTWFRDYLYIPLGGSQGGTGLKIRNVFIIFLVSGFWHGANWTFIFWGALNALYFLPLLLSNRNRTHMGIVAEGKLLPQLSDIAKMISTFAITVFAFIFFRAETITHAFEYIEGMFSTSLFSVPQELPLSQVALVAGFMMLEWLGRESEYAIENFGISWSRPVRRTFYYGIGLTIFVFIGHEQEYIYFQF